MEDDCLHNANYSRALFCCVWKTLQESQGSSVLTWVHYWPSLSLSLRVFSAHVDQSVCMEECSLEALVEDATRAGKSDVPVPARNGICSSSFWSQGAACSTEMLLKVSWREKLPSLICDQSNDRSKFVFMFPMWGILELFHVWQNWLLPHQCYCNVQFW